MPSPDATIRPRDMSRRYIRYPDGKVRSLTESTPEQFDALAVSILGYTDTNAEMRAALMLKGIERDKWDTYSRWWFIDKFQAYRRCKVYTTKEEAERA